jgi:hypothetical protein
MFHYLTSSNELYIQIHRGHHVVVAVIVFVIASVVIVAAAILVVLAVTVIVVSVTYYKKNSYLPCSVNSEVPSKRGGPKY